MFDPFGDQLGRTPETAPETEASGEAAPVPAPAPTTPAAPYDYAALDASPTPPAPEPTPTPSAPWAPPVPASPWAPPVSQGAWAASQSAEAPTPEQPTPVQPTYEQPTLDQNVIAPPAAENADNAAGAGGSGPGTPPPAAPSEPARRRRSPVMAGLVAVSLVASGFAVARASERKTTVIRTSNADSTTATVSTTPSGSSSDSSTEPVATVASTLAPSVVQIETTEGLGAGFIYDSDGHILTAAHVVSGAGKTVTVRLSDGTSRKGTVVGADSSTDVAVVKIDLAGTKGKPASLALNNALQVGQTTVVIGSPFGLEQTVTSGIVSAVDRAMQTTNGAIDMVQTDAPINPGNSGGPLADLQSRVIGINDQIESESGSSSGVGFAIPIDTAKAVADKIVDGQPVTFAFLGVQSQDTGNSLVGNGALIVGVQSGSPADRAGVQQGDTIVKLGDTAIDNSTTLSAAVRQSRPGDVVKVTVKRNGSTKTLSVTLGSTSAT